MKAFPRTQDIQYLPEAHGMDLRDYFAAAAMSAYIKESDNRFPVEQIVKACYEIANSMMEARKWDTNAMHVEKMLTKKLGDENE